MKIAAHEIKHTSSIVVNTVTYKFIKHHVQLLLTFSSWTLVVGTNKVQSIVHGVCRSDPSYVVSGQMASFVYEYTGVLEFQTAQGVSQGASSHQIQKGAVKFEGKKIRRLLHSITLWLGQSQ